MSLVNYLIMVLKCLPYHKIIFVIISVLKQIAKKSDNKLDDMLIDIIENILLTSLNPKEPVND